MSSCAHTETQNSKINLVQLQQGFKLQQGLKLLNHRTTEDFRVIRLVRSSISIVVYSLYIRQMQEDISSFYNCSSYTTTQAADNALLRTVFYTSIVLAPTPTLTSIVSRSKRLRSQSKCSIHLWYMSPYGKTLKYNASYHLPIGNYAHVAHCREVMRQFVKIEHRA